MTDLLWHVADHTIPAALSLLPGKMDSPEARAILLAIGIQESGFAHRRQVSGPARGFFQMEQAGGVAGVLNHPLTHPILVPICDLLLYPATSAACYPALEHNDTLATVFARLLLYTDPRSMPAQRDAEIGWRIYLDQWKPGKPRPEAWRACWTQAWTVITG